MFVCVAVKECTIMSTNQIDEEQIIDALAIITDTGKEFELYTTHIPSCVNQSCTNIQKENKLKQICADLKGNVVHTILIVDFDIKFEKSITGEVLSNTWGKGELYGTVVH